MREGTNNVAIDMFGKRECDLMEINRNIRRKEIIEKKKKNDLHNRLVQLHIYIYIFTYI